MAGSPRPCAPNARPSTFSVFRPWSARLRAYFPIPYPSNTHPGITAHIPLTLYLLGTATHRPSTQRPGLTVRDTEELRHPIHRDYLLPSFAGLVSPITPVIGMGAHLPSSVASISVGIRRCRVMLAQGAQGLASLGSWSCSRRRASSAALGWDRAREVGCLANARTALPRARHCRGLRALF